MSGAIVGLAMLALSQQQAPWTAADVLEMRATASPFAQCVLDKEVGGYGHDPYRNGAQGERGPFQLHPQGKLLSFYAAGYTDPHSPWEALHFFEWQISIGEAKAWPTVRLCQ